MVYFGKEGLSKVKSILESVARLVSHVHNWSLVCIIAEEWEFQILNELILLNSCYWQLAEMWVVVVVPHFTPELIHATLMTRLPLTLAWHDEGAVTLWPTHLLCICLHSLFISFLWTLYFFLNLILSLWYHLLSLSLTCHFSFLPFS